MAVRIELRSLITWLGLALSLGIAATLFCRTQPALRRRVKLALRVTLVGYGLLFLARLALAAPEREELVTLAAVLGAMGLIWLILWLLVRHKGAGRRG